MDDTILNTTPDDFQELIELMPWDELQALEAELYLKWTWEDCSPKVEEQWEAVKAEIEWRGRPGSGGDVIIQAGNGCGCDYGGGNITICAGDAKGVE